MFGIFKKRDKSTQTTENLPETSNPPDETKVYVKGAKIAYYPNLINEFKEEHAQLFSLYSEIVQDYEQGRTENIADTLREFKRTLVDHLMRENILLYVFLKYLYVDNNEHKQFAYKMQKEMTSIGNSVFDFIQRAAEDSYEYNSEFKRELDAIGTIFVERVELEETSLYNLYVHPDNVT